MAVTQRVTPPAPVADLPVTTPNQAAEPWWPRASWGWRAVELIVLCSFAFLQPVLAELDGQFFLTKDLVGLDVVVPVLVAALLPPGLLVAIELLVQRRSDGAAQLVHLGFVAALLTAFASGVVVRTVENGSVVQAGLALVAGAIATLVYVRAAPARSFLRVLAPAPVLFVALFLLTPPVSGVVFPGSEPPLQTTSVRNPVVVVLFDEFPSTALMNSREEIDAERFPNFARLAREATWFRNATTVHAYTKFSVPAIVSGDRSKEDSTATPGDHPTTLFTLLGGTHEVTASTIPGTEWLCPEQLCPQHKRPAARRYGSALRDMGYTSFQLVLPDAIADELPAPPPAGFRPPKPQLEEFIGSIRGGETPRLYFVHAMLPHTPYIFLPSGDQHQLSMEDDAGFVSLNVWGDDRWPVTQMHQRQLLQVAYVDRLLGQLVDRMKEVGIYDRAALVLIADHGISLLPGDHARSGSPRNLGGIMPVTFFIKGPGQREGEIRDEPVQTIDMLPTLAGTLGVRLPWDTEGVDALSRPVRRTKLTITTEGEPLTISTRELLERRRAILRRQVRIFGEGSIRKVFAAGPHPELLGTRPPAAPAEQAVVRIDQGAEQLADHVPDSGLVPSRIVGHLTERPEDVPIPLAVALNGRIRATTWTYEERDRTAFSAMLPPSAVRPGRNELQVFAVEDGGALRPLGP